MRNLKNNLTLCLNLLNHSIATQAKLEETHHCNFVKVDAKENNGIYFGMKHSKKFSWHRKRKQECVTMILFGFLTAYNCGNLEMCKQNNSSENQLN